MKILIESNGDEKYNLKAEGESGEIFRAVLSALMKITSEINIDVVSLLENYIEAVKDYETRNA